MKALDIAPILARHGITRAQFLTPIRRSSGPSAMAIQAARADAVGELRRAGFSWESIIAELDLSRYLLRQALEVTGAHDPPAGRRRGPRGRRQGEPREPRRLPTTPGYMVPERGKRRDCARYNDCLTAHLALYPSGEDVPASCPSACPHHAPVPDRATDYMQSSSSLASAAESPRKAPLSSGARP